MAQTDIARAAQMPPDEFRPRAMSDCMTECPDCHIEWCWGAPYDVCKRQASRHNSEIHGAVAD